jgi:hypothetical protein
MLSIWVIYQILQANLDPFSNMYALKVLMKALMKKKKKDPSQIKKSKGKEINLSDFLKCCCNLQAIVANDRQPSPSTD